MKIDGIVGQGLLNGLLIITSTIMFLPFSWAFWGLHSLSNH